MSCAPSWAGPAITRVGPYGSQLPPEARRLRTPRARIYGEDVAGPLRMIWATLNGPSGKRLAPFMAEIVEVLERYGELEVSPDVRDKLRRISAVTIDRMLAPQRARLKTKGPLGHQARDAPQTPDPDPHLRRLPLS